MVSPFNNNFFQGVFHTNKKSVFHTNKNDKVCSQKGVKIVYVV